MPPTPALDEIDRKILSELHRDGRLTNADLARRVGLSASPCWTRVRALEKRGVIKGYSALVDRKALGLPETIVVEVTLEKHGGDAIESFTKAVLRLPEVIEAAVVAGDCDFHLKVASASTADYERFLREKLYRIPGVRQVRSIFILRELPRRFLP